MSALCYVTPYLYYSALISLYLSLFSSCAFFFCLTLTFKTCLPEHLYHKDCTTTRQSWLFSFYVVVNNKQDEMKLENIESKLQSSFVLLQFVRLSILHYTTEHSKESPFFLMLGRDPVLPLNTLLEPKIRYLGNDINVLSLEAMKNVFEIAATNLKLVRERRP